MTNKQSSEQSTAKSESQKSIANLTLSELEQIIEDIAKRTLQEEIIITKQSDEKLLDDTFGAWEDDKTEQEIIQEIYDSRAE